MDLITAPELRSVLHYRMLIERLRQAYRAGCEAPERIQYPVATWGEHDAALALGPAWQRGLALGLRVETSFPDNPKRDLPTVNATYLLYCGKTGVLRAILDGRALAIHRAAAVSALAASYLARPDADRLLVVGTGALAPHLIEAHAVVLPLRQVLVWGRDRAKAEKLAQRYRRGPFKVTATDDLPGAVAGAHVICCATSADRPLIQGEWLAPGAHLGLSGGVSPDMREACDETIRRARVFIDSRDHAGRRAGDILDPIANGTLAPADIAGDLFDLTRGERGGRRYYDQITLFKSVGTPVEDLAAAGLAVEMVIHNDSIR